jgi:hypothetical protein
MSLFFADKINEAREANLSDQLRPFAAKFLHQLPVRLLL